MRGWRKNRHALYFISGPVSANGLANLHNASRAQVPIVNLVGQHATYHLRHDTPLDSDIEGDRAAVF